MPWNLFIDDERYIVDVTWAPNIVKQFYRVGNWKVARSWDQVAALIRSNGMPSFISFDHDLGENEPTGYDIIKYLIEDALDHPNDPDMQFPKDFDFYVHSQNPIGKKNIESFLNNYLKQRNM